MRASRKIKSWDGKNKGHCRLFKLHDIRNLLDMKNTLYEGEWDAKCLTFAGANAILERILVNQELIDSGDITTIQTYERMSDLHCGQEILNTLLQTRKKYLPEMRIWPYSFESFSKCYTADGCSYPSISKTARWFKKYKNLMDEITEYDTDMFSILDLDLCGIFSKKNAESIVRLMENKILEEEGVLFITHQKGRDMKGGNLLDTLYDYLEDCPYIDLDSIMVNKTEEEEKHIARYILIPLYYMCKAYDNGYVMSMKRIIEHRDIHKGSTMAVNMLQYFFEWEDKEQVSPADQTVRINLEKVIHKCYKYYKWID